MAATNEPRLHKRRSNESNLSQFQMPAAYTVALPLLESACHIVADASHVCVRPLLDGAAHVRLARRALRARSLSNVRVANATYASLFFDQSAHTALTPLTVEGDAQALLFAVQRAAGLFHRARVCAAAFESAASQDPQQSATSPTADGHQAMTMSSASTTTPLGILQVVQTSALELCEVIAHARSTVCAFPVLLRGSAPDSHMLLHVRDAALRLKELCAACVRRGDDGRARRRTASAKDDAATGSDTATSALREAAECRGLLFSDASWTDPSLRRDLERAERWLLHEELPYIAASLRELIATRLAAGGVPASSSPPPLLACCALSSSSSSSAAATPFADSDERSVQRSGGGGGGDAGAEFGDEDPALRLLQLSLQRVQIAIGTRVAAQAFLDCGPASRATNNTVAEVSTTAAHGARRRIAVPPHIACSPRYAALGLAARMEVATTVRALAAVMDRWRRWVRARRERSHRVDMLMRRNCALHCLWRLRVWQRRQSEVRAARRAAYGIRAGREASSAAGAASVAMMRQRVAGTQTVGSQNRFVLRMVE